MLVGLDESIVHDVLVFVHNCDPRDIPITARERKNTYSGD
jgi:hypothetical protein